MMMIHTISTQTQYIILYDSYTHEHNKHESQVILFKCICDYSVHHIQLLKVHHY